MKESPTEAEIASHNLMLRAGLIRQLSSGIYTYLPLGLKTLNKISCIVREEMDRVGGQELLMPAMQPGELWKETGRWDVYGPELVRFRDRRKRDFCLGPTHEEVITDLVRRELRSYRDLPVLLYQIQVKFRDEIRPRFGVMRSREFIMKDLYSFDTDREGMQNTYEIMYEAYCRVFERCGLQYQAVRADSGVIGGDLSHEFLIVAQSGEEKMMVCRACKAGYPEEEVSCSVCGTTSALEEKRGIEVGHIFQLGTKYSQAMNALFVDKDGSEKPIIMGCYGIGIGRTMGAAIEAYHDEHGIQWPWNLAPYQVYIIPVHVRTAEMVKIAETLYNTLQEAGYECVLDDRDLRAGHKFKDADLLGFPVQLILGDRSLKNNQLEVKIRSSDERVDINREDVLETLESIRKKSVHI